MVYKVRVDRISQDINEEVRESIVSFLQSYDFPYVTIVQNKTRLQALFYEYFNNKRSLDWLKNAVGFIATQKKGISAVAMTEVNRLHTAGLGNLLLSKGQTKCKTIHTYGYTSMDSSCRSNLEEKILDIKEILKNSFPSTRNELTRIDLPMIPQHVNCRHVMAPLE